MKAKKSSSRIKRDQYADYLDDTNLVYGSDCMGIYLIIVPKSLAEDLATVWEKIEKAKTLGELKANLPAWLYDDVASRWEEYRENIEEQYKALIPGALTPESALDVGSAVSYVSSIVPRIVVADPATIGKEIERSRTWGELEANLSQSWIYKGIVSRWEEYRLEIAHEHEALQPAALTSDSPFDGKSAAELMIDYSGENPWPIWVAGSMSDWIDGDVAAEFGGSAGSMVNGTWLTFDLEDTDKIVAALIQRGYNCEESGDLTSTITPC